MRISAIVRESIVDGPGIRFVVFTQGCHHHCPGCHNPETHDPDGGYLITPEELAAEFKKSISDNPLLDGVTITGGEPLLHASELLSFLPAVREAGFNIWLYTGYTIEEIITCGCPEQMQLIEAVDRVVDGRFLTEQRTLDVPFVGSKNQRIIVVKKTLPFGSEVQPARFRAC